MTRDRTATRDEVLAHRERLRTMAREYALSAPRVDVTGTIVAHSDSSGYGPVKQFATAASALVGAWVNVITDDVPAAQVDTSAL